MELKFNIPPTFTYIKWRQGPSALDDFSTNWVLYLLTFNSTGYFHFQLGKQNLEKSLIGYLDVFKLGININVLKLSGSHTMYKLE